MSRRIPVMAFGRRTAAVLSVLALSLLPACSKSGGGGDGGARQALTHWNHICIDASGLDHTPVQPGEPRIFGEQVGPCRSARAVAIVQIAVFDAMNAILGGYESFTNQPRVLRDTSLAAAIGQAAHDTMIELWPSQAGSCDDHLTHDLASIPESPAKTRGIEVGRRAAAAILTLRRNDGSAHREPRYGIEYVAGLEPGVWRQDPISQHPLALGAFWGEKVRPFVMTSASQFRTPPPPAMTGNEYTVAYNEAKVLGGDGVVTPTARTEEQTFIGTYWAYDGTPSLCAPPRLYNQIAVQIAEQMRLGALEMARLLALANTAMADAGLAIWESKYHWKFWRPVAGIRESDPGTGPTGLGDGNPNTIGDPNYTPLGAPASNLSGPNFTPPFPAYPSGHAGFGGALFQTLRRFFGRDDIRFTFVSDEFNGRTRDNQGRIRPYRPRTFTTFSQAEEENGQSRIYLGIHWSFDKTEGITQGRLVADQVFDTTFRPQSSN